MTKRNLFRLAICLCFSYFHAFSLSAQSIHYVDFYATGANDGSSWQDAYISLQTAMGVAEYGDEIWVAEGTYKPTNAADRNISFELPLGVKLYGSFNGTESSPEERDLTNLNTVLSGDIGLLGLELDNSYTVLYVAIADSLNLVDGMVIENGQASSDINDSSRNKNGAGLYLDNTLSNGGYSILRINHCRFENNYLLVGKGGGAYAGSNSSFVIKHSAFFHNGDLNHLDQNGTSGGGLHLLGGALNQNEPLLEHTLFKENYAIGGSAVYISTVANEMHEIWIKDCRFTENIRNVITIAEGYRIKKLLFENCSIDNNPGRGVYYVSSLGLFDEHHAEIVFEGCRFENNNDFYPVLRALCETEACNFIFDKCHFLDNIHTENIHYGNEAFGERSCISLRGSFYPTKLSLINCFWLESAPYNSKFIGMSPGGSEITCEVVNSTLIRNAPDSINALLISNRDTTIIKNSIIDSGNSNSIFRNNQDYIDIDNSLFNHDSCSMLTNAPIGCNTASLFGLNPLFTDPENGDFTLQAGSPAIDAGINTALLPADSLDINGQARIINGIVDMGAYEWAPPPPAFAVALDSVQAVSCPGGTDGQVFLSLLGTAPFEINWENENDGNGTGLDSLSAGNYTFTITDAMGSTETIVATITQPPTFTLAFNSTGITCPGESNGQAAVIPSGGTPPYSYSWNDNMTDSLITGLAAGIYWVTVSDAHACERIAGVNLNNPDSLSVDFETIEPACFDEPNGTIIAQPTGGTLPYSSAWWNGVNGNTLAAIPAGFHPYYLTDANGCTLVDTAYLDQPEILSLLFDYTPVSCPFSMDAQLVATGQGGTPPFSYTWSTGVEGDTLSMIGTGTYTVSIEDGNACQADFSFITPPITPVFVAAGVDSVACSGMANGVIGSWAQGTLPIMYEWSTGDTTTSVSDVPAGLYSITITDASGCIDSTTVMMPELPPIELELVSTGTSASANNGTASIVGGGSFSYTYLWNTGATTPEITGLAVGIYEVSVTDDYGCEAVFSVEVELINTVGQVEYSSKIPIYPNPVKANLIVELPSKLGTLRFYNTQGKLVQALQAKGYTDLRFHQPAGIYFYEIEIDERVVQRGKLVVAR